MLRRLSAFGLLLFSQWAFAFIEITGLDNIQLGVWSGSGGLMGSDNYCLVSKQSATSTRPVRYDVAAYGPDDGAGNFVLLNASDNSQLPIQLTWNGNTGSYVMTDYNVTRFLTPQQNGAINCGQAAANISITIEALAGDLASARAGTYSGTFEIDALQSQNPRRYVIDSYTVTIPELVQISGLDDIDLGVFNGGGDAVGSDQLCIFRNGAADYALRASGGLNATDPFVLNSGGNSVDYSVAFREGSGSFTARTPGQLLNGLSGSPVQNCGGGSNAEIEVRVSQAQMMASPPGTYTGVLYIVAEAQ
ncbi:MAG: hypothetical protein AB8B48_12390 [Pseudomonadales bacterium]